MALNVDFLVGLLLTGLLVFELLCFLQAFHVSGNFGLYIGILLSRTDSALGVLLCPHLDIIDRLPNELRLAILPHIRGVDLAILSHKR